MFGKLLASFFGKGGAESLVSALSGKAAQAAAEPSTGELLTELWGMFSKSARSASGGFGEAVGNQVREDQETASREGPESRQPGQAAPREWYEHVPGRPMEEAAGRHQSETAKQSIETQREREKEQRESGRASRERQQAHTWSSVGQMAQAGFASLASGSFAGGMAGMASTPMGRSAMMDALVSAPFMSNPATAIPYLQARGGAAFANSLMPETQRGVMKGMMGEAGRFAMHAGSAVLMGPAGIPALVTQLAELPAKIADWGDALVTSQQHLAAFNGQMALVFAEREVRQIERDIRSARRTVGSTAQLSGATEDLKDALAPLQDALVDLTNRLMIPVVNGAKVLVDHAETFSVLAWALKKWSKHIEEQEANAGGDMPPFAAFIHEMHKRGNNIGGNAPMKRKRNRP